MPLAPSPDALSFPFSPSSHSRWPAASPSLFCIEESKFEAQRCGARECGSCSVNQAWTGTSSSLCNRETEDQGYTGVRIKLYSQTVPSQRGLGDHIIQQFTTLATLGIISLSNIPALRPYPGDADIRGLGSAWALVYFKAFSGNLEGPPVGRIADPVQCLLSLQEGKLRPRGELVFPI